MFRKVLVLENRPLFGVYVCPLFTLVHLSTHDSWIYRSSLPLRDFILQINSYP